MAFPTINRHRRDCPANTVEVDKFLRQGWRPVPFRQFILKLHSQCNLACHYCYVYESVDQSWRSRPARMARETLERAAERIAEHVRTHALSAIEVVLHGGEPLLAGAEFVAYAVDALRTASSPALVRVMVQTNGLLLTEKMLGVLLANDVGIGVSLDGDRTAHNRHRRYANGRETYDSVASALRLLSGPYRALFRGILCTVDLENGPLQTYEALLEFDPPTVDLLLPHGNWTTPPPRRPTDDVGSAPYGDWLVVVFDRWYNASCQETRIRLFEEIINLLLGGASQTEQVGLSPAAMVVIDTDGTMQQVDTLKTTYPGAPETGLTVTEHSFDIALRHPAIVARQIGVAALGEVCQSCRLRKVCGGGNYSHRYKEGAGFRNPSVYCPDLTRLIDHIAARLRRDIAELPGRPHC